MWRGIVSVDELSRLLRNIVVMAFVKSGPTLGRVSDGLSCDLPNNQQLVTRLRIPLATILNSLIVAIATLVASCGAETGTPESWAGEVQHLPGGAVLISNPAAGMWDSQTGWTLEETLRIGSVEGEGPDVFGEIDALEVGPAGRIYVFDGFDRELRVFGPDGGFVASFGRRGSGPGEFEGVDGVSLSPDGAIWVIDGQNARYTAIRGDDFETYRRDAPMYHLPWIGGFTAEGVLYDAVVLPGQPYEVLLRVDSTGIVTDTFPIVTPELDVPRLGRTMQLPLPYAPKVLRTFDRRGSVWTAVTDEYRLVQMSVAGDTVMIVTRDYAAPALTSAQEDSVRRYVRRLEAEFGIDVRNGMIPRSAPILRSFFVDDHGYLWVCRGTPERCSGLDVFDDAGRFLGEVELPFRLLGGLKAIVRQDNFYAVAEGVLGVPAVVRARIRS